MSGVLEPFDLEFFRNGFAVAVLAGALCALVGTFVIVRGMAYLGHGLSHAVFAGFAVAALLGVDVVVGAAVWGVVVALAIGRVSRGRVLRPDATIGVLTLVSFALGLALLQWRPTDAVDPDTALFGSVLGVSRGEVAGVAVVAALIGLVVVLRYRSLVACSFSPDVAAAAGVRVGRVEALLLVLLALAVLTAMNVMGATLVAAGVVLPPAAVRLLTGRFARLLLGSTLVGAATSAVGMVLSYHVDVAPGPIIVLVQGTVLAAAAGVAAVAGAIRRARWRPPPRSGPRAPARSDLTERGRPTSVGA